MVNQNEIDEEQIVDELTTDQQAMDQQQGLAPAAAEPQYLTAAQAQEMVSQHTAQLRTELRGLQGLYDKGLNAIRSDTQQIVEGKLSALQEGLNRRAYLESLDEDTRNVVQPLYTELDSMRSMLQQKLSPEAAPAQTAQPQSTANEQWQRVYQFVRSFGVDPNDASIRYSTLVDQNLTAQERQDQFVASLRSALQKGGQTGAPAARPQPATANPPVEAGRSGANANVRLNSLEDVVDARANNLITNDKYTERMAELGFPV